MMTEREVERKNCDLLKGRIYLGHVASSATLAKTT